MFGGCESYTSQQALGLQPLALSLVPTDEAGVSDTRAGLACLGHYTLRVTL